MAHIFVSYDSEDREQARAIVTHLEAAGWSVWWDRRIPTGKTWRAVLDKALEEADCMLVLWSSRSIESHWVIEEAEEGLSRGKLLPLSIEVVRPPRGFREIQALSFVDWDGSAEAACFRTLLQDLAALTSETPGATSSAHTASVRRTARAPGAAPAPRAIESGQAAAPSPRAPVEESPAASGAQAARSASVNRSVRPTMDTRKLAAAIGIAAIAALAFIPYSDRMSRSESSPGTDTPTAEAAPDRSTQTPSAVPPVPVPARVVEPSSSLLVPVPSRDESTQPGLVSPRGVEPRAPIQKLFAAPAASSNADWQHRERELEERRRQRQAEIDRKIGAMNGSPSELQAARSRMEIEAVTQDQAEMTQALEELNRAAQDAIKSIKAN